MEHRFGGVAWSTEVFFRVHLQSPAKLDSEHFGVCCPSELFPQSVQLEDKLALLYIMVAAMKLTVIGNHLIGLIPL